MSHVVSITPPTHLGTYTAKYPTTDPQIVSYQIVLQQDEDGRFVATCPDLPGVVTDGANEQEAMKNTWYAVSDMLDSLGRPSKEFNLLSIISI